MLDLPPGPAEVGLRQCSEPTCHVAGREAGLAPPRLSQPRADRRAFDASSIKELSIGVTGRLRE
jgi:hypothetical protein